MNDIVGNVAQELADHLDDLRESSVGVGDQDDDGDREFPVTEVGDPEDDEKVRGLGTSGVSFYAVVGGQRVKVMVTAA